MVFYFYRDFNPFVELSAKSRKFHVIFLCMNKHVPVFDRLFFYTKMMSNEDSLLPVLARYKSCIV